MRNYKLSHILAVFKQFIIEYKLQLLISLIIIILSALIGIYTILNTGLSITIDVVTDANLLNFLKNNCSPLSFIFYNLINNLFLLFIMILGLFSVFLIPITLFIVAYKAYYFFLNITILIKCFNIFGIFNTIFIILPVYIGFLILYLCLSAFILKQSLKIKKGCANGKLVLNTSLKIIFAIIIIMFILLLIEVILLSIFSNKFIIS